MIVDQNDRERMWLLVTGTGRCGTGYIAHVLSSCGINCTHEKVFGLHGLNYAREQVRLRVENPHWGWRADCSWYAMPFLSDPVVDNMTVVHLVRHPRNVIRSLERLYNWTANRYDLGREYLYRHMPKLLEWDDLNARSAYFWLAWNDAIEKRADVFHRLEDPVEGLLDQLDIEWRDKELFDNTHYNTRAFRQESRFELEDLPRPLFYAILSRMDRYGYELGGHQMTRYEMREKGLIR